MRLLISRMTASPPARKVILFVLNGSMVFTLTCLITALPAQEDAKAMEVKKLEGEWVYESYVVDGKRLPTDNKDTVTFQKYTAIWHYTVVLGGIQSSIDVKQSFELVLNSEPKKIIFKNTGPPGLPYTRTSSYRLSNNRLEICYRLGTDDDAPKVIESKDGSGIELITLKRVKKEK